jgi:predicted RNA-binding protein with RPS1 domain
MTTPAAETLSPASELKPKTRLTGKVVKTTLAGALLDIGMDIPGIVHISQMSETPVKRVEDVLQVGQEVPVWVRKAKADRVELTMIEPLGVDWRELKPEMTFKGKVIRLETYGAFVEIGAERPGLVHISEMAHGYVKTPGDVVKEGDEVDVMVLEVDRKKKQIRLSMKATQPEPEEKPERPERAERPERPERAERRERPERGERKRSSGGKRGERQPRGEKVESFTDSSAELEPTAFELAWKQALERSKAEKAEKSRKLKVDKRDQEDLLERTLKNRMPTA